MRRTIGALAGVMVLGTGAPGIAQDGTVDVAEVKGFDAEAPAWKALRDLSNRTNDMEDDTSVSRETKQRAWQVVYDAAMKVRVGPQRLPHPLSGFALIQMAVGHHELGDDKTAMEQAKRSLELLRPFRNHYSTGYIQAVSMVGLLASNGGRPSEALAPLKEGAEWYEARFADKTGTEQAPGQYMAKSNVDYAYAQALSAAGRFDEAAVWQLRSYEARRDGLGPNNPNTIGSMWNYGLMLYRAGRGEEGETWVRNAVEATVAHVDIKHPTYVRTFDAMGIILGRRGKRAESVEYLRRSIDIRRQTGGSDNMNFFSTLHNLGDSLIQLERYSDARALLLEAWEGARRKEGAESQAAARSLVLAGVADAGDGNAASAAERLAAGLKVARDKDASERLIGALAIPTLIVAQLDSGRTDAARRLAEQYLAEVRGGANPQPFDVANAELLRAYAAGDAGAGAAARNMVTAIRRDAILAASGELPQEFRASLDRVLRVAVRDGDAALALDAMVILAGSRIAQANRLVAERIAASDSRLTARIRERQDAAKTFQAADRALLTALASGEGVAAARRVRDDAAAKLDAIRAGLTRDYPAWSEASGALQPDLAALRKSLAKDQAIVAAIPAFDGVYTLTVTRAAAQVRRTPLARSAIVDLVGRVRSSLPAGRFDREAAETLYEQLFPAADAAMLRGVTSLRFVPAGPLAALPIDLLLTRKGAKPGRAAPYLIKRYAVSVSPAFVEPAAPVAGGRLLLGVGDPTPFPVTAAAARPAGASVYFRGGAVDAVALGDLPRLPAARAELDAVARDFGSRAQLLTGDDASEARLKAMDLSPFGTILFATHALVSGEMEGVAEPALVLARPRPGEAGDGILSASEIATLDLDADWVILSACNTAAGDTRNGAAYSGLAQAFRYAGARTLMLSHWPIRDDAARFVTVETIANTRKGMRRDVALQRAMLKLMASRRIADAGDPFIWAPFILLGDVGA